jgi:ATP-dependent DNA helicase RecG
MNGKTRLAIMKNSNDGFFIAEEDLKLRGQGEMAGKRQSGLPEYKIANLDLDLDLLQIANRQAQLLLENQDKKIDKETLRILLTIFNYEDCFKLVFGG